MTMVTDRSGSISQKVELHFQGHVGGTNLSNGNLVQVYGQFENPLIPGEYSSFTCSTTYDRKNDNTQAEVKSFKGTASLETSQNDEKMWDKIALNEELPNELRSWYAVQEPGDLEGNENSPVRW